MFTCGELGYAQHARTMNNEYHALCTVKTRTMLPGYSVMLPEVTFERGRILKILSLAKTRQKAWQI